MREGGVKLNSYFTPFKKKLSLRWINFTSVGSKTTAWREKTKGKEKYRRLSSWHQVWRELFNKPNYNERDQWIWPHLNFYIVQKTSKTATRGATGWDAIMFICMNSYKSRGKKIKVQVFTAHWKKWMMVKKQITDSETLIANKMLNLSSSEGNSNKTMKYWAF